MKYFRLPLFIALVMSLLGLGWGCVKNEICLPSNNILSVEIYEITSDTTVAISSIDSLTLYIVGREDSILYNNSKKVETIEIPLSDSAVFLKIVAQINAATDTIYLNYTPFSVFRSTECGVVNRYQINEVMSTTNNLKAIYLQNKEINENEAINLSFFVDLE